MKKLVTYLILVGYVLGVHLAASILFFEQIAHACSCDHDGHQDEQMISGCGGSSEGTCGGNSCGGDSCGCDSGLAYTHHEQHTQVIQEVILTPPNISIHGSVLEKDNSYAQRYDTLSKPPD